MKVNPIDTSNLTDLESISRFVSISLSNIISAINGNLSFADNFAAQTIGATFTSTNVDVAFAHNLNRVPSGYIILNSSAAMSVFSGNASFTAGTITLRSNAVGNVSLLVF